MIKQTKQIKQISLSNDYKKIPILKYDDSGKLTLYRDDNGINYTVEYDENGDANRYIDLINDNFCLVHYVRNPLSKCYITHDKYDNELYYIKSSYAEERWFDENCNIIHYKNSNREYDEFWVYDENNKLIYFYHRDNSKYGYTKGILYSETFPDGQRHIQNPFATNWFRDIYSICMGYKRDYRNNLSEGDNVIEIERGNGRKEIYTFDSDKDLIQKKDIRKNGSIITIEYEYYNS